MTLHVLLCSHNGARFIAQQIASIRAQSRAVDVIHVFDHASDDGTRAVLSQLASQPGAPLELHWLGDAPGPAMSFLRAIGYLASRVDAADSIFLADQDDVWLPGKVAAMLEAAAHRPRPWALFHDVQVVDEALAPLQPSFYTGNPYAVPRDLDPRRLLLTNPVVGHTLLLSGDFLALMARLPGQDAYVMHDWAVALVAQRMQCLVYVPQALSLYRQHGANLLGASRERRLGEQLQRGMQLAERVLVQAMAWARAPSSGLVPAASAAAGPVWMSRPWAGHSRLRTALHLAFHALVSAPTLRRRALGIFLLLQLLRPAHGSARP
ncbi:glycosyl transferase [Acidovorax sp. CF316]|uniref:glycosyltransferase n=1 Tax=Acidovorax sp. CF316 TaxID=1144317 RepID=UPI00026BD337|nr:glycosyltransferase [Acidovorax sp. CF316]EJE53641.1 glycosyl transferase [Acidovorax sp. CF316]